MKARAFAHQNDNDTACTCTINLALEAKAMRQKWWSRSNGANYYLHAGTGTQNRRRKKPLIIAYPLATGTQTATLCSKPETMNIEHVHHVDAYYIKFEVGVDEKSYDRILENGHHRGTLEQKHTHTHSHDVNDTTPSHHVSSKLLFHFSRKLWHH